MFLFKKVKGKRRLKTQASLEVLSRLNNYLDENVEEPVEFLVGFWKDQEDAFTYKEIRQAILDGAISEETMRLWMQDYSILVAEKMYPVWEKALAAGPFGQPIMDAFADEFVFDIHTASVLSWINERGANFITAVTQEQKKAIKAMLARHVDGTYTVLRLLVTETNINYDVTISDFEPIETGAYGNIDYSITFTIYKELKIYTTSELKIAAFVKKTVPRPTPAPQSSRTHTVKSGDTLWGIASKYYGSGTSWQKIYSANSSTIEATAKRYRGGRGSDNGHWIYPGTVLTIP